MQKYEKYKDSGVEWIGEIPEEWEVKKIGSQFEERKEKVSDKEYEPLSVTKLGIVPRLESAAKSNAGDNRKKVCKDDFVINSRSDRKGSSGVSNYRGSVSLISIVLKPRNIEPSFIHYLFRSYAFQEEFYRYGKGIVDDLWSTNYSEMKNINIAIPSSIIHQQKIATFLDTKSKSIENFIKNKQKLIGLLEEEKKTIITNAVTRGVNPDVNYKKSGVERIGDTPEHWEIRRLKFCVNLINNEKSIKNSTQKYIGLENIESWTGKIIESSNFIEPDGVSKSFNKGNVLFSKLRPYLAKAFVADFSGICTSELLVFKTKLFKESFLLMLYLNIKFINLVDSSTYGSKMPRANWNFIGNILVSIPPLEEQQEIVTYIEQESKKIDDLKEKYQKEIDLIKEYKERIIYDVVTGKMNVQDYKIH
ncbi:type I restriction enzyme, S subunit [Bathymodiolus platifrons methanotrophic gill symbiont]|uniref:restriction endonuclease subunit S n=1 Tax=Bathymodiolus platifrons methanotrophic gill symbiont TaxID=113268 RepID=UPI001B3E0B0C|nr:restriction endonuclease subunit S [Bathymodiolus platifrons methanotrophic gill symbiont]GFO77315.1 type I restriction enzyme, S subunit [Bathymodiolus platifrons methanotrophic gill symbiont]